MKLRDVSLIILISILVICVASGVISSKYLGDDNPVEETAEKIIDSQTGIDVDLTPNSKENQVLTKSDNNHDLCYL